MPELRRTAVVVVSMFAVLAAGASAAGIVVTFEDLPSGPTYGPGEQLFSDTVPITISALGPGASLAQITTAGLAAGGGKEVLLSNAQIEMTFAGAAPGLAMQVWHPAMDVQSVSLTVNGQTRAATSLEDLNGQMLGGTLLFAPSIRPSGPGALFVVGEVFSFAIGGQLLALDNVIAPWSVPEPATLALVALGAPLLMMNRRRMLG